jgi:hypothetical protein
MLFAVAGAGGAVALIVLVLVLLVCRRRRDNRSSGEEGQDKSASMSLNPLASGPLSLNSLQLQETIAEGYYGRVSLAAMPVRKRGKMRGGVKGEGRAEGRRGEGDRKSVDFVLCTLQGSGRDVVVWQLRRDSMVQDKQDFLREIEVLRDCKSPHVLGSVSVCVCVCSFLAVPPLNRSAFAE